MRKIWKMCFSSINSKNFSSINSKNFSLFFGDFFSFVYIKNLKKKNLGRLTYKSLKMYFKNRPMVIGFFYH
jgi:hypothetical protein